MNVSAPFVRRKVMTTLLMVFITGVGLLGYQALPVSDLPNVDFPTISVTARLPGANPDTMAAAVATPLEKQFSAVPGLDGMSSVSGFGITQITLQFALDRDIDGAALDVQSAISQAQGLLPPDMPSPPSFRKTNPADYPILLLALTSNTLPMYRVDEYAQTTVGQRLSTVSGVAQVTTFGSQKYAVRVQADPRVLAARGVGIDQVAEALRQANTNLPTGSLQGKEQAFTIRSTGQLTEAASYRPVIVTYRNGSPVRLSELGRVIDGVENEEVAAWFVRPGSDGQPLDPERAIVLAVYKQPGSNTVGVAEEVKAILPTLRAQLPPSVGLDVLIDRSGPTRESIRDVQVTLLIAFGLVVLVIFLFLRNLRATLIPSLALPVSVVATFAVMWLLNYSLDNLSLLALTLAVGFVVDDAIVMLENIVRHLDMGKDPRRAALDGSAEVGFTIVSMTVSLVAVFIPVLFMSGIVGRLLREFAVTISVAIVVSGVVSVTLTPMLCGLLLRRHGRAHGRAYRWSEGAFNFTTRFYDRTLRIALRHKFSTLLLTLAMVAGTAYYLVILPKGFLPSEDTGQIYINTEGAQGISFEQLVAAQRQVAEIVRQDENVEAFTSSVGISGPTLTGNAGRLFIRLKPRNERKLSAEEVAAQLRPKLATVPGLRVFLQVPPPIRLERRISKSPYQITLSGPDTTELYKAAPLLEQKLRELPDLRDVTSDLLLNNPQVTVRIDRDQATRLGVSARSIEDALANAYGTRQVSTIYAPNNEYQVILELAGQYRRDPEAMRLLYVRGSGGQLVSLDTIVKLNRGVGPLQVNHTGQLPSVTLSFALRPGASLGDNLAQVDAAAHETLPATITTSFQGTAQAFQASAKGLGLLLIAAVVVIYLVMGMLYESFIHPITILSGLPSAGIGALVTLQLFGSELNLYSSVGLVLLIGIVKKNAIMMVDFALDAERTGGKTAAVAIHEAALVRFRPIMMTTMAALLGGLPIALGLGAGSESRRPLGLAVVGGLIVSQFLTLYITPVIYIYLDKLRHLGTAAAPTPVVASEEDSELVSFNGKTGHPLAAETDSSKVSY
ncbi:MAG TPA: efflux RND transporter permease subunit [Gemmataceae bacterium]|nr:efflux RND transporter permease subunit [Gemmataceae bacterium]